MLRIVPFVLLTACVGHADGVGVGACARDGEWVMTFVLTAGSDPVCPPLDDERFAVAADQIGARECGTGCICDTVAAATCAGTLTQTCDDGTEHTAITCSYDLGFESGAGECTASLSGDVTVSCRYAYTARYIGPVR